MSRNLGRALQIITAVYWAGLFISTHVPSRVLPVFSIWDKLLHTLVFAILGTLLYFTLWMTRPGIRQTGLCVLVILVAYAAIDELLQIPVGRSCSLLDWIADVLGVCIAVGVCTLVRGRVGAARPAG